jgi:hypothetical protein
MSENEASSPAQREEAHHVHLNEVLQRLATVERRLEELEEKLGETGRQLHRADAIPTLDQEGEMEIGYP